MPEDAEAFGYGIRAKRSKFGAVSFDALSLDGRDAPLQWVDRRDCGRARQGSSSTVRFTK
jgi:hypothetical protein